MSDINTLSSSIQSVMNLGRQEATGWHSCKCPVCNSQRVTGGFLFEGDKIFYKCFRASCDSDCAIVEGEYVSRKFKGLMKTIGVDIPINLLVHKNSKIQEVFKDTSLVAKHEYDPIQRLPGLKKLASSTHENAELWIEYFNSRRTPLNNLYMIEDGRYYGNVALAMYFQGMLIGYTIITPDAYIKDYHGNSNILYLPDGKVYDTMLVVEGVLDARSIPQACATTGSSITPEQAYILRNASNVIMVPDRTGNKFIDQCYQYGWKLSLPDWKYKDVNKAVVELGTIETVERIMNGVIDTHEEAMIRYKLWLDREAKWKKN